MEQVEAQEQKTNSVSMTPTEARRFLLYLEHQDFFDLFDFLTDGQRIRNVKKLMKSDCLKTRSGSVTLHFNGMGDLVKLEKHQLEDLTKY